MSRRKSPLVVVALGGNALLLPGQRGTHLEQEENAVSTCRHLAPLLRRKFALILTHGNGPQVGNVLLQNEAAADRIPPMPLDHCVADTQGSLGHILQQALLNRLREEGLRRNVVTLVTHVEVDPADPAFADPTKPVGPFFDERQANEIVARDKWVMREDSGRGWRRVVPSPRPLRVLQAGLVRDLALAGHIVIAVGGGGIPVCVRERRIEGVEAVIDKDLASACLAREVKADVLLILTEVPAVYRNFGRKNQKAIPALTTGVAKALLEKGEFPRGSMGPKIEAAVLFLEGGGERVLITNADALEEALERRAGTWISPDGAERFAIRELFD